MTEQPPVQQSEQITTPERSPEELYLDALEKKRDTLLAFHTMNPFRKSRSPEDMTSEELENYKALREDWRSKKENSLSSWDSLSEEKQQELAAMGSRLFDVHAKLTLLKKTKETTPGSEKAEVATPEVLGQEGQETSVSEGEGGVPEAEESKGTVEQPEAERPAQEQAIEEKPESGLSLADVEDRIARLENSSPAPLLMIEAWKAKRDELMEREDAEANPEQAPPKGFLARVKDSYNRVKNAIVEASRKPEPTPAQLEPETITPETEGSQSEAIKDNSERIREIDELLAGKYRILHQEVSVIDRRPLEEEIRALENEKSLLEKSSSKQEAGMETPAPAKKDAFWTSDFWKERLKGVITPFGFLEFYRVEKFRRPTGEVAGHVEALASLIQQEQNLTLEEAEKEAWEIVNTLKEQGLTISASEFYDISKDITERKKNENDEEAAYIVKTAEDEIYDKLQERGHKGEAGQELLTRENQLAIRENLFNELNKLRDGALATDRKELAKLIRRNLDEKWNWRYVWGGVDTALWFLGIATLSTKFLASKEAVAVGAVVVAGGAGGAEAAREFVETGMHENVWNTLKEMAENGPGKFTPTDGQLKEWSQSVLGAIKHYEPEWMNNMIEGLKSSRTMPESFSLKVPMEVMREMKYPGF